VFVEVTPHTRLVIDMHAVDAAGAPLFRAYTEVTFSDALAGTQMDVVQTYSFIDPAVAAPMVAGASEGWRTTLDKLEQEVLRAVPVETILAADADDPNTGVLAGDYPIIDG
jgi:uncharacterized protein YndB with AHSA1/START domain